MSEMRRFWSIVLVVMALVPIAAPARTIADFFATEPGNIFTLLTRTYRMDMVDYYKSGQTAALPNNLAG